MPRPAIMPSDKAHIINPAVMTGEAATKAVNLFFRVESLCKDVKPNILRRGYNPYSHDIGQ